MRFGVGIITYQGGQWFLRQALESVWGWADEVVVVDGSNTGPSTDNTAEIFQEFHARSDSKTRFKAITLQDPVQDYSFQAQQWLGQMSPEMDYILRVDADEVFHRGDLELLNDVAEVHHPDTILFEYRHFWQHLGQIQTTGCYNQRANTVLRCFRNVPSLKWFGIGGDEVQDSQGRWLKGHPYYARRAFWAPIKCYHLGHAKSAQFEHAKTIRYRTWDNSTLAEAEEIWKICGWATGDMGGVFPYRHGQVCNETHETVDLPEVIRPENYDSLSPLARHCALNEECSKIDPARCVECFARSGLKEKMWEAIQWKKT